MNYKIPLAIALTLGLSTTMNFNTHDEAGTPKLRPPKKLVTVYMIYQGTGPENLFSSYTQQQTVPPSCGGFDLLCYFQIPGDDDGTITETEFNTAFDAYDTNDDGSLDDETEQSGVLEKLTLSK